MDQPYFSDDLQKESEIASQVELVRKLTSSMETWDSKSWEEVKAFSKVIENELVELLISTRDPQVVVNLQGQLLGVRKVLEVENVCRAQYQEALETLKMLQQTPVAENP